MTAGKIHIGTSGWSYKHWKEVYYPEKIKATEWLKFFSKEFHTTEINTSFYHLPKPETVTHWVENVPRGFKFCPKISRYLTHMKKLHDPEEPLQRFFEVFAPAHKHLGPVLVQLPPFLKYNEEVVEHFFKVLKTAYRAFKFALEVRHETWLEQEPIDLMKKYKIAFVISQSGDRFPYEEFVTAKDIYVRFHGPGKLYASSYSDEMLQSFADKFKAWQQDGHNVWAYFNNDLFAYALQNARTLIKLLEA